MTGTPSANAPTIQSQREPLPQRRVGRGFSTVGRRAHTPSGVLVIGQYGQR